MDKGVLESKFDSFSAAVRTNGALDSRITTILHLATAMAIGCAP